MNRQKAIKDFLLLVMCLIILGAKLSGQVTPPENFPKDEFRPENISLITDRSIYISGENIWFSVRCYLPNDGHIQSLSKTMYIELFDNKNNKVHRQKLKITGNRAKGFIPIPNDLQTGYYYVRAFTTYARNFLPEYYPIKVVEIINPDIPPESTNITEREKIEIFPANKKIISGINNHVAIRIDPQISTLIDSIKLSGGTVGKADSGGIFFQGNYAFFSLIPTDSIREYCLKFYMRNKDSLVKPLQVSDKPEFLISRSPSYSKPDFHFNSFSGKSKDMKVRVFSMAGVLIHEELIEATIKQYTPDPGHLHAGINYILFTDVQDSLLHFSAVFRPFPTCHELKISSDKEFYQPREKVQLSIENPDGNLQIREASISVVKKGTANPRINGLPSYLIENIFLLSAADLVPETAPETMEKLINIGLILHEYKWDNSKDLTHLLNKSGSKKERYPGDEPLWLPETREILLSGIAKNKGTGKAAAGVSLIASVLFDRPQFHINTTDQEGNFFFSFYGLHNTKEIVILPLFQSTQAEIMVNSDFGAKHAHLTQLSLQYDSAEIKLIRELYINAQLTEIFSGREALNSQTESPDVFGDLIEWTKPEDYIALTSMHEVFKEIVPSARLLVNEEKAVFGLLDAAKNVWYDNPLVLLDNIPINDTRAVADINPSAIEKIGVINSTYILGDHFLPGIILIRSKSGKFAGVDLSHDAAFLEYQMYTPETSYNSVEYNSLKEKESNRADFRNTLYWNPEIKFDADTSLTFFTSDHISEYEVIIDGYTCTGKHVRGRANFAVKK